MAHKMLHKMTEVKTILCPLALLGLAALIAGSPAAAQTPVSPAAPLPATNAALPVPVSQFPVKESAYLLAPEDGVSVAVSNFPNLSCQAVIQPDGTITVPLIGDFSVLGQTTAEVARTLSARWKKYVINPSVTVSLTQRRPTAGIVFYGFAKQTGGVPFRASLRLTQALAQIGGVAEQGDAAHVILMRRSGEKLNVDLSHPEALVGTEQDIVLREGDIVYVPERRAQVSVLGEVVHPGNVEHKETMTVLDALTAAGGLKESADLSQATLLHNGKESKLDLDALLRRGDVSLNTKLSPGDSLTVPETPQNRTYVFGAVSRPGYYSFKPGDRLLDALNSSSPTPQANMTNINLIRVDKVKNTAVVRQIDLDKFFKKGDIASNALIEPGDVIFLSDKRKKFQIQDIFGLASGLNVIDSSVRILGGGVR